MSVQLDPEALTTVDAVRDGFSTPASDDAVARQINRVSARFKQRTGCVWAWQVSGDENPEYVLGMGRPWLFTARRPITAVSEIVIGMFASLVGGDFTGYAVTDYKRTAQWDAAGKIYRLATWPMIAPIADILTGAPDTRRPGQQYSVQVKYSGGYVLPRYDGIENATYNPTGAARNLPYQIEDACITAVREYFRKPVGGIIEERTAGGWSRKWSDTSQGSPEFPPDVEAVLWSEARASVLFR